MSNDSLRDPTGNDQFFELKNKNAKFNWSLVIGHWSLKIWHIPRKLAIGVVHLYQKIISPDHSFWSRWVFPHGHCKHRPSCSEYTKIALKKYGFIKGTLKGIWRTIRCNPWSKGGIDMP